MGLPIGQNQVALVKSGSTLARLCGTHIFGTAGLIYTIRSSMELSRHMGLPIGQNQVALVKSGSTLARLCGTHIFGTAGLIYTIRSSMELSRPVVVQHQGHLTLTLILWLWIVTSPMTLTLDFQGQILKMLYLRNGRAWNERDARTWVHRMLDPHCDFELWPHPWPWPLNFKVKFWKCRNSAMDARLTWNERDVSR